MHSEDEATRTLPSPMDPPAGLVTPQTPAQPPSGTPLTEASNASSPVATPGICFVRMYLPVRNLWRVMVCMHIHVHINRMGFCFPPQLRWPISYFHFSHSLLQNSSTCDCQPWFETPKQKTHLRWHNVRRQKNKRAKSNHRWLLEFWPLFVYVCNFVVFFFGAQCAPQSGPVPAGGSSSLLPSQPKISQPLRVDCPQGVGGGR